MFICLEPISSKSQTSVQSRTHSTLTSFLGKYVLEKLSLDSFCIWLTFDTVIVINCNLTSAFVLPKVDKNSVLEINVVNCVDEKVFMKVRSTINTLKMLASHMNEREGRGLAFGR